MTLAYRRVLDLVLLFIFLTFISYVVLDRSDQINSDRIDSSIKHAQLYLKSVYSEEYLYDDPYIRCLSVEQCDPRFKKIDAAIDLIWIRDQVTEHSLIDYQIKNADEFLKNQTILLENEPVFDQRGVFIGDQHCILASMYNDTKITKEIDALVQPYGWANRSLFNDENMYRKIAYESWCVMFLAEKGSNKSTAIMLSEFMLNESLTMTQNPKISSMAKGYAALHSLLIFKRLGELGYNISYYEPRLKLLQDSISAAADDKSLVGDTNAQSIFLMTLSNYKYPQTTTKKIALRLLERQNDDGGWQSAIDKKDNTGESFTTLHAILALNQYKLAYIG
ncbi:hypothetical protein H0N99_01660 [Candidatus Micrarchaeota archaeon]|nr:hypothetical protein [Candidatus Micrarchaeota archaeon]